MKTDQKLLQEAIDTLMDISKFLHHCWCNVRMNDYSLEILIKKMVAVDEQIKSLGKHLAQPENVNQCGETCERAKLCATCSKGISKPELLTEDEIDQIDSDNEYLLDTYRAIEQAVLKKAGLI